MKGNRRIEMDKLFLPEQYQEKLQDVVERVKEDPYLFAKIVCGFEDLTNIHREMTETLIKIKNREHLRFLELWPRGTFKCLCEDTAIFLADGTKKTIGELINEEDIKILSLNESTMEFEEDKIVGIKSNGIRDTYKITTTSGNELIATGNHPILTVYGWRNLSELEPGILVAEYVDGLKYAKVKSIEYAGKREVYDVAVEKNHNFISNGIVTHNSSVFTIAGSLWLLVNNPEERIYLCHNTREEAMRWIRQIRKVIEGDVFQTLFPELVPDFSKVVWKKDAITINRKGNYAEASVTAGGVDKRVTGNHYTVIILDDIVVSKSAFSDLERQKVKNFYSDVENLLESDDSAILVVGCVTEDTNVLMADGTWKRIKDVKEGEYVKSFDDFKLVNKKVLWSGKTGHDDIYEVKTANSTVKANAKHPFLVIENGKLVWKKTTELKRGDRVVSIVKAETSNDTGIEIIKSVRKIGKADIYDITVEDTHNFIAEGLVTHNTRWHVDDLYNYIITKRTGDENSKYNFRVRTRSIIENGKLIFPERFKNRIESLKKEENFWAVYMNSPTDPNKNIFHAKLIEDGYYKKLPDMYSYFTIMTIDPAGPKKKRNAVTASDTAIIVAKVTKNTELPHIYVVEAISGKWSIDETADKVIETYLRWNPDVAVVESNSGWVAMKSVFEYRAQLKGLKIKFEEVVAKESKEQRAYILRSYIDGIRLHLRGDLHSELESQLVAYPSPAKWDLIDALAYVPKVIEKYQYLFGKKNDPNFDIEYEPAFEDVGY